MNIEKRSNRLVGYGIVGFILLILVGPLLIALPATLSLGWQMRPGIEKQTISQAVSELRETGETGWDLVESARKLVGERMQYCRRNSFDHAHKAFERGYGYCQQSAFALVEILNQSGFDAKVVSATRNRFSESKVGGHAWVRVTHNGETRDIDPKYTDPETGKLTFEPLTEVFEYSPIFRVFAGWSSMAMNAYRFYVTGRDFDG